MQINLRQARRLERSLQTAQQKLALNMNEHRIRVSMHADFDKTVQDAQAKIKTAAIQSVNLVALRFAIRKAIETQNEVSGINALMNEEAKFKELAKVVEQATAHVVSDEDVKIAKARHVALVKSGPTHTNHYGPIDHIDIEGAITSELEAKLTVENKSFQKRLVNIVEQIGVLNTTTLIKLSEDDLILLEKFDIAI